MAKKKTPPKSSLPTNKSRGLPVGYAELLDDIKARIRAAQLRAALAINGELLILYWRIGREILARQQREGWGGQDH